MELLQRKLVADETVSKPFEQFWMGRLAAVKTQVVRGQDQPRAKVVMPETVSYHAGEQRVLGGGDPARDLDSPIGFSGIHRQTKFGGGTR